MLIHSTQAKYNRRQVNSQWFCVVLCSAWYVHVTMSKSRAIILYPGFHIELQAAWRPASVFTFSRVSYGGTIQTPPVSVPVAHTSQLPAPDVAQLWQYSGFGVWHSAHVWLEESK
jgi:hypothetical protein